MNKKIVAAIFGIFALFGFLFLVYQLINTPPSGGGADINVATPNDHIAWSPEKKNLLIEYSDLQCPACRAFHFFLKSFEPKNVTFIYRHFPLYQIHPNAFAAAYAAEAAGRQGKFFPMLDILFEKQEEWSKLGNAKDYFVKLASELKLDTDKFRSDINSKEVKNKVGDDLAFGEKAGVAATPTFFLNGKKLEIKSWEEFKKLLLSL